MTDPRGILEGVYPPQQFYNETGISDHKVFTGDAQERIATLNRLADATDTNHESPTKCPLCGGSQILEFISGGIGYPDEFVDCPLCYERYRNHTELADAIDAQNDLVAALERILHVVEKGHYGIPLTQALQEARRIIGRVRNKEDQP